MKRVLFISLSAALTGLLPAQNPAETPVEDLSDLSLEELQDVEVEIVSKKQESLARVPAAVTVLNAEDIRRIGAQTLPGILRQAIGVNVAQQNANFWAVSVRGFNDVFANKLLVMLDGRSVYSPLFSGTFWDVQDVVLADIERIEIVRGPGATVWGANAVNGVINIISKSARETQGTLFKAGYGSELQGVIAMRHGYKLSDELFLRIYGKHANWDNHPQPVSGISANDRYYTSRGGFRADYEPEGGARVTVAGEIYGGKVANTYTLPPAAPFGAPGTPAPSLAGVGGGHLRAKLEKDLGDGAKMTLQAYYDRSVRQTVVFDESRDIGDVEAQWNFSAGTRHDLAIGAGYRVSDDDMGNLSISFNPQNRVTHLFSAFVQDDIELVENRTRLSLGTKLQHNQFTGFEVQPGARLSHAVSENQVLWASVTRAVRTPSRVEDDVRIAFAVPANPPTLPVPALGIINGTRAFETEDMIAWEIGHRSTPFKNVTLELAGFYNQYNNLRSIEGPVATAGGLVFTAGNKIEGEAYGIEIAPVIRLAEWWQLRPSYAWLQMDLRAQPGSIDTLTAREEDQSPDHTVTINSRMNLGSKLELDVTGRYVDQIFLPRAGAAIESYWAMDVRIGWNPKPGLQFSLIGQGLLAPSRQQFAPTFVSSLAAEAEQSIFGMMTCQF